MNDLHVFPFLHPSYGQCGASIDRDLSGPKRDWLEVTLRPGELLYIPPFWLHEVCCWWVVDHSSHTCHTWSLSTCVFSICLYPKVIGVTPSVAFNVWTGIDDEDIFQKVCYVYFILIFGNS